MSTTKEELIECQCGDWYPPEECRPLHGGGYVHEDDIDDYVQLSSDVSEDYVYCHQDEALMCDCNGEWYPEDSLCDYDVEWDNCDEVYRFTDNMCWGYINSTEEGWFNNDTDYCYSDRDDIYFMNGDVAERRDYRHSENADDYLHIDDLDNEDNGEEWDNTNNTSCLDKRFNQTFGIPYTFGVEIETCEGFMDYQSDLNLKAVYDGSISGKEYVTGCMSGNNGIHMLKKICNSLSDSDCYTDSTCGIHVHIGGANFNRRFSILSIMLGNMLEDEIFSMLPKSRSKSSYCLKIPNKFYELRILNLVKSIIKKGTIHMEGIVVQGISG